jgi:hypothetical protein
MHGGLSAHNVGAAMRKSRVELAKIATSGKAG